MRTAHLDLQLAQAASEGAAWAVCDLAGLPMDTSEVSVQAYKDRWGVLCVPSLHVIHVETHILMLCVLVLM
jgi:hypothetical protein